MKEGIPARAYKTADLSRFETRVNGWKVAFFVLLTIVLVGNGGLAAYFLLLRDAEPPPSEPSAPAPEARSGELPKESKDPYALQSVAELAPEELFEILPKNLLRRFHAGEPGQGRPDDYRVIKDEKGEYVVLIGGGKLDGDPQASAERIMILQYEANQFRDVTRHLLPSAYSRGTLTGRDSKVKFDSTTSTIIVREPASPTSLINECPACEHAFRQVTLEWKSSRYNETGRAWANDRYTALYVVADALDRRLVDDLARAFIDQSLDDRVAEGFARGGNAGWSVRLLPGSSTLDTFRYEINNGEEIIMITLSSVNDQWRAVRISDE